MEEKIYDVIIIGAGPAGLTAGIYTSRARLDTAIIESMMPGGQAAITEQVDNYPGFPDGVLGPELVMNMDKQSKKFGAEFIRGTVIKIENSDNNVKVVYLSDNKTLKTLSVIICSGTKYRHLNVPGENEFVGKGVSFCATCDGPFFREKEVVVVGGGNTAVEEANYLTKFAKKVYIIHRRGMLRATKIVQEKAEANNKIEFILNSIVTSINGINKVESVSVKNKETGEEKLLKVDGAFIFVGFIPNTKFLESYISLTDNGYIDVDKDYQTDVEGIFAAGDCLNKKLKQIITACGDGASAAFSAQHYIDNIKGIEYK